MRGDEMTSSHPYDYEVIVYDEIYRIEVKYSGIHDRRKWSFNKAFGQGGQKEFDFLLLIALADERFFKHYHPHAVLTGLVCFAIPISVAKLYCYQGGSSLLNVPTNPFNHRPKAAELYRYQIGTIELWEGRAFARLTTG